MPKSFSPGHRPDSPLYPYETVYTTPEKVSEYLQLPLPDPVALAGDTVVATVLTVDYIKFPITGADFRRWGYAAGESVLVYDNANAVGNIYKLTGIESVGSAGQVYLVAKAADQTTPESFTTNNQAYVQHQSAFTNSNERGIKLDHVKHLIANRQDYIDKVTRHAWRPRLVAEEYQNFTTFKPFRRRYYTDYVGAIFVKRGAIQRVLKLGAWQGDYYREMAGARAALRFNDHTAMAGESILLCPGANGVATLTEGSDAQTKWRADFDNKSAAENLSALVNKDPAFSKAAVPIGSLTVESESASDSTLNVHNEFLGLANSDMGDGVIEISSMRSTEGGENATLAVTNDTAVVIDSRLTTTKQSKVVSVTGNPVTSFTVDDGTGFVKGHSLVYYTVGNQNKIALVTRSGNTFTIVNDEQNDFDNAATLIQDVVIRQNRFKCDITDEERQKSWWSIEENGMIAFNNEYPFFENHSLRCAYIYGERYVEGSIQEACTKLVVMDILMSDDYSVLFPEGTSNMDINTKHQKLEAEVAKLLVPFQESIVVAGMGG